MRTKFKVDNAIILAAGLSSRFAPLSFERPKGLAVVNGERLIERQIRQLEECGINEIIIVVGNMKEKFEYLATKYKTVRLVYNKDYKTRNTHSSLYAARDHLKNTYILCSDNYYNGNPFKLYEEVPYTTTQYLGEYVPDERGVITSDDGLIISTELPANNRWCMLGYQLFDEKFSKQFKKILEDIYEQPGTESLYWERVYSYHVPELQLYEKKVQPGDIMEFDTVRELEEYNPRYLEEGDYEFVRNICSVLECKPVDISNFEIISKGLTNKSFSFFVKKKKYIYRFPSEDAPVEIDRELETANQILAKKIGIDNSFIYEDSKKGWKISKYIEVDEPFDFHNQKHIELLCQALRKFNNEHYKCGVDFNYISKTKEILELIKNVNQEEYKKLQPYYKNILKIEQQIKEDGWDYQLSHNDIWEENLLVKDNELYLIDWEYAGDTDIGYDISKLCVKSECEVNNLSEYLVNYFERYPTNEELNHLIGCTAVSYYYWTVWATYMILQGHKYESWKDRYNNVFYKYYVAYINNNREVEEWN